MAETSYRINVARIISIATVKGVFRSCAGFHWVELNFGHVLLAICVEEPTIIPQKSPHQKWQGLAF
ncbi:MAG: hypothetical protein ACFB10_21290 [Salibacteraceae bacterium]